MNSSFFFPRFFLPLSTLSLEMAHPGADYDPYDGIVSNPNKKKNPLVLVGACWEWMDDRETEARVWNGWTKERRRRSRGDKGACRDARGRRPRPRPRPLAFSSSSHSHSQPTHNKTKQNAGTAATAGVLIAGLVAFRQVRTFR